MEKIKQKILENLKNTFCRLKCSGIEGIGIFAIKDIPEGDNPFKGVREQKWRDFTSSDLNSLDKNVKTMISDFFAMDENEEFSIPDCGLNGMDISFFLNTSSSPNVKTIDGGTNFVTTKEIKNGEELTVSYSDYDARYKNSNKQIF